MKFSHVLLSLVIGTSIYLICTLAYAPVQVHKLREYAQNLQANNAELQEKGDRLEHLYWSLRDNPDAIIPEAFRIGFVFSENRVLQLRERERRVEALSVGEVVNLISEEIRMQGIFRNVSLVGICLVLFLQLVLQTHKRKIKRLE